MKTTRLRAFIATAASIAFSEGTKGEINRLVIIQMLLKRAMTGTLSLIPAAKKLGEENCFPARFSGREF